MSANESPRRGNDAGETAEEAVETTVAAQDSGNGARRRRVVSAHPEALAAAAEILATAAELGHPRASGLEAIGRGLRAEIPETACRTCGTDPGPELIRRVAVALSKASFARSQRTRMRAREVDRFRAVWDQHKDGRGRGFPLPANYPRTIRSLRSAGLPMNELLEAVQVANYVDHVASHGRFAYFAGICWRKVDEIRATVADAVAGDIGGR